MKIKKGKPKNKILRIKLAEGEAGGEPFVFSVLANGAGLIMEFDKECYTLATEELVKEILRLRG